MAYKAFTIEEATSADINTYLMNQAIITCTSSTRPGSPISGMRIWQTDTVSGLVYTGSAWETLDNIGLFAYKTANESVFNSATLQDDNHLFVSVAANCVYLMDGLFITGADAGSGNGPKITWSAPSGATMSWSGMVPPVGGASSNGTNTVNFQLWDITTIPTIDIDPSSAFTPTYANIYGVLLTGGSAGTLQLRWAQSTAVTVSTFFFAKSWLRLTRIA